MAKLIDEYLGAIRDRNVEMAMREIVKIILSSSGAVLDDNLIAIAALTGTGYLNRTGPNTWSLDASPAGTNGARVARLTLYQWAASAPATFPSGTSTFTWATGAYTAPGTLNGWSLTPGVPAAGQTLYEIYAYFTDSLTTATSVVTWSSTTIFATGKSGNDGAGDWASLTGKPTDRDTLGVLDIPTITEMGDAIDLANTNPISITHAELTTFRNEIIADPLLAPALGVPYVLTDAGVLQGQTVRWDGEAFVFYGSISNCLTAGLATRTSDNATDSVVQNIHEVTIPGFLAKKGSRIVVQSLWQLDALGTKETGTQIGSVAEGMTQFGGIAQNTTNLSYEFVNRIQNAGALNVQRSIPNASTTGGSGNAILTFTKNTAIDFKIGFSARWTANQAATSVIRIIGYTISILG